MGKKYNMLNEAEFKKIKMLIGVGLTNKQLRDVTGRSSSCCYYVEHSEDFAAYKVLTAKKYKPKATPVPESPPAYIPPQAGAPLRTSQELDLNLLNNNIVLLAGKLERYALATEALTIATYALRKTNKGVL